MKTNRVCLVCYISTVRLEVGVNAIFFIPWQKFLKASSNQIESLPDLISIFWKTHLREVDFSDNVLKELPSYMFELEVQ